MQNRNRSATRARQLGPVLGPMLAALRLPALALLLAAPLGTGAAEAFTPESAFTPEFPAPATAQGERRADLTSYRLPTGPFRGDAVPAKLTEGSFRQTAWRLDWAGRSTLELLSPLREQLAQAGWTTLYECETAACGGFDFRYGIDVLPEPEMHVDLGDFRYLAASRKGEKGMEYLSFLVSRSADQGFVQLTHVGGDLSPDLTASTKSPGAQAGTPATGTDVNAAASAPTASLPAGAGLGALLSAGQAAVLEDLAFASGMARLKAGDYPSLRALADWLVANPTAAITLVGHTDASGSLTANTALSQKRAASIRDLLVANYGIAPDRITAEGVGPADPRADNATTEGRLKNRRVEVVPTPTRQRVSF